MSHSAKPYATLTGLLTLKLLWYWFPQQKWHRQ